MALPVSPDAVVNLKEALGVNGTCVQRFNVPHGLLCDPIYRKLVFAYIGRSKGAQDAGLTHSDWEPRQHFLDACSSPRKQGFLGTIAWAAEIYGRVSGIRAEDFELLLKFLKLLEDYWHFTQAETAHARAEVNLRLRAKQDDVGWTLYHRQLSGHERACLERKVRPVLEAKGYSKRDIAEILEVEWVEHLRDTRDRRLARLQAPGLNPYRYSPPKGITSEEKQFARAIAQAIREGEGNNWQILSQLRAPAYPNNFRKADYFRLAVSELVRQMEHTQGPVGQLPESDDLTRAEKATIRCVRARVLDGKDIHWDELLGRVGSRYPNQLSKRQVLILASELQSARADPGRGEEEESEEYFSAQQ